MTVDENLYNDKIINHVFGGAPTGEVLDAFKKIKFTVLDITDKENVKEVNAEAVLGNLDRMSLGSYYINNLEKGKKYVIQVQLDSIPDGYFYYFEKFENGSDQPSTAFLDPTKLKDGVIVDTDQMGNNLFGHIRLHLRVMDVIFAKDKETAEHIYNFKEWVSENDGQTYWDILSWNKDLKEGVDYKKACVNKDRSVTIPEGFQKEGYKPLGWVFSYDGWKDQSGKAKEFSFEGMLKSKYFNQFGHPFQEFRTDTGINSIDAVLKAHSYSVYLKSMLPEVTFNYNFANDQGDTLSQKQNVFYGKSFSNNKTTTEELPNIEVTPEREGYVFLGWNTSSDGSGDTFDANTIVNDNLTVYAMWAKSQSATATVIDQDGAGLKGQTVEVYDADDAHVGTITTDERGLGYIHNLLVGKDYTFKLMLGGRVKEEQTVTINENYISGVTFRLHSDPMAPIVKLQSATATVIDQDGTGLKGQTVEVYDADGTHVGTITTDERGLGYVHNLLVGKDYTFKLMLGGQVKEEKTVTINENYISSVTFRLHSEPMTPLVPAEEKETDNEKDNKKDEGKGNKNKENEKGDTKEGKEKDNKNKLPKAGAAVGLGAAVAYLFSGIGLYGVAHRKEEQ